MRYARRLLSLFLLQFLSVLAPLPAQTLPIAYTHVTLSSLSDGGRVANASFCATPADQYGNPISFSSTAVGFVVKGAQFCGTVVNGALTSSLGVPNACATNNANPIFYNFTIQELDPSGDPSGVPVVVTAVPNVCGVGFAFDAYTPVVSTNTPLSPPLAQGPGVPLTCTAPSIWLNTAIPALFTCQNGGYVQISTPGAPGPTGIPGPVGPASTRGIGNAGRTVYEASSWTDLSGFTQAGGSASIVSNQIFLTGTTGDFNHSIVLNQQSDDPCWDFEVYLTVAASQPGGAFGGSGSNWGVAIGALGVSGQSYAKKDSIAFLQGESSPIDSLTLEFNEAAITGVTPVSNPTVLQPGDLIRLVYSQRWSSVTLTYDNYTQRTHNSITYDEGMGVINAGYEVTSNSYKPAIWLAGGAYTVTNMKVISRQSPTPYVAYLGDSKTWGATAGAEALRFASLLKDLGPTAVFAGPGDGTADLLADLPYILKSPPVYAVLCIGYNDVAGYPLATIQANYTNIVNQLQAAGVTVIHLTSIPSNSNVTAAQVAPFNAWLKSTYTLVIDTTVGFNINTMLAADQVHPNQLGHAFVAKAIRASGFIPAYGGAAYEAQAASVLYPAPGGAAPLNNASLNGLTTLTNTSETVAAFKSTNSNGANITVDATASGGHKWGLVADPYGFFGIADYTSGVFALGGSVNASGQGRLTMPGGVGLTWRPDAAYFYAPDTGFFRTAPGTMAIGYGSAGDSTGTLAAAVWAPPAISTIKLLAGQHFELQVAGAGTSYWNESGFVLPRTATFGSAGDTGLSSPAPGVYAIGNGTNGDASGTLWSAFVKGPATAPSGSTTFTGWCFSQDGHISYANGSTWSVKF